MEQLLLAKATEPTFAAKAFREYLISLSDAREELCGIYSAVLSECDDEFLESVADSTAAHDAIQDKLNSMFLAHGFTPRGWLDIDGKYVRSSEFNEAFTTAVAQSLVLDRPYLDREVSINYYRSKNGADVQSVKFYTLYDQFMGNVRLSSITSAFLSSLDAPDHATRLQLFKDKLDALEETYGRVSYSIRNLYTDLIAKAQDASDSFDRFLETTGIFDFSSSPDDDPYLIDQSPFYGVTGAHPLSAIPFWKPDFSWVDEASVRMMDLMEQALKQIADGVKWLWAGNSAEHWQNVASTMTKGLKQDIEITGARSGTFSHPYQFSGTVQQTWVNSSDSLSSEWRAALSNFTLHHNSAARRQLIKRFCRWTLFSFFFADVFVRLHDDFKVTTFNDEVNTPHYLLTVTVDLVYYAKPCRRYGVNKDTGNPSTTWMNTSELLDFSKSLATPFVLTNYNATSDAEVYDGLCVSAAWALNILSGHYQQIVKDDVDNTNTAEDHWRVYNGFYVPGEDDYGNENWDYENPVYPVNTLELARVGAFYNPEAKRYYNSSEFVPFGLPQTLDAKWNMPRVIIKSLVTSIMMHCYDRACNPNSFAFLPYSHANLSHPTPTYRLVPDAETNATILRRETLAIIGVTAVAVGGTLMLKYSDIILAFLNRKAVKLQLILDKVRRGERLSTSEHGKLLRWHTLGGLSSAVGGFLGSMLKTGTDLGARVYDHINQSDDVIGAIQPGIDEIKDVIKDVPDASEVKELLQETVDDLPNATEVKDLVDQAIDGVALKSDVEAVLQTVNSKASQTTVDEMLRVVNAIPTGAEGDFLALLFAKLSETDQNTTTRIEIIKSFISGSET